MKIAMYQMEIVWGDIPANLQKVKSWLEVHSNEADLLVLPEMFATGFCVESPELSEDENGQILRQLRIWSETYHIAIIGSMMWRGDGDAKSLNRAFLSNHQTLPSFMTNDTCLGWEVRVSIFPKETKEWLWSIWGFVFCCRYVMI